MMLARLLSEYTRYQGNQLHLFDTFEGMPETDERLDIHADGDFADCSLERVEERVRNFGTGLVELHQGLIPETFSGLESHRIAFAHIDVDIFRSVQDCCEFIYPRLVPGGFMVFDDYGFESCPGTRRAVDDYFVHRPEFPLVLPTGQALVFKSN